MINKLLVSFSAIFFPVMMYAQSLDFESVNQISNMPTGWSKSSSEAANADSLVKRSGSYSLHINGASKPQAYAMAMGGMPYAGDTLSLRGYIKTAELNGYAKITLSLLGTRGDEDIIANKNFTINETTHDGWAQFELKSALCPEVRGVEILCRINGIGKIWLDDLEMIIDGKPVAEAERKSTNKIEYKATLDKEFDNGSGFVFPNQLSAIQVENLNALARVWGLLKYYHPAVARGDYNWDYELFRIMPKVYNVDADTRNKMLLEWVESLGPFEKDSKYTNEGIKWVSDTKRFGNKLSEKMVAVSTAKKSPFHYYFRPQFEGVPEFYREAKYPDMDYGDSGMKLLGVFRLWNAIEFFYPYRYMTDDRDEMLSDAILNMSSPEIDNKADYVIALYKLLYGIHDSHGKIVDYSGAVNNKLFTRAAPFITEDFVEGKFVIKHSFGQPGEDNLQKYDAITHIDGQSVEEFIDKNKFLFPASNKNKLAHLITMLPTFSTKESVAYTIDRNGATIEVEAKTYPLSEWSTMYREYIVNNTPHELTHKIYNDSIAYINLEISGEDLKKISKEYFSYPMIVIDNRKTSDEGAFDILMELLPECTIAARYRHVDFERPGNFTETNGGGDYYAGSNKRGNKIVVIVDHNTQSYMEYLTMMLQNIPGMITLGSQTSGADGNMVGIGLPGDVEAFFTSLDWFYPDGRQCQGVGVHIDEIVTPTLKGVREGRDELLERAIEIIKQRK